MRKASPVWRFAIFEAAAFAQPPALTCPARLLVGFRQGVPDSQVEAVVQSLQGPWSRTDSRNQRAGCFAARPTPTKNAFTNAFKKTGPEVEFWSSSTRSCPVSAVTPNDPSYSAWQSTYLFPKSPLPQSLVQHHGKRLGS